MHPQAWFCHAFQQAARSHPYICARPVPPIEAPAGLYDIVGMSKQWNGKKSWVDTMEQGNCEKGLVTLRFAPPSDPSAWWGSEPLEMGVEMGLAFYGFRPFRARVGCRFPERTG